jgi:hypothetical protein
VTIETDKNQKFTIKCHELWIFSETFEGRDAYISIPLSPSSIIWIGSGSNFPRFSPNICKKITYQGSTWEVIHFQANENIAGYYLGKLGQNNQPAWIFHLKKC